MKFTEKWMGPPKQKRLLEAMAQVEITEGEVVEVGCWEGRSSSLIANHFYPQTIHCVDHWLGNLNDPHRDSVDRRKGRLPLKELAASRDVFATFTANMAELTEGNYTVHKAGWRDALADWVAPIKFIFIDAQHTYEDVFDNICWALPFVKKGGIIAGDDYTMRPVAKAVKHALVTDIVTHPGPGRAIWYWRAP